MESLCNISDPTPSDSNFREQLCHCSELFHFDHVPEFPDNVLLLRTKKLNQSIDFPNKYTFARERASSCGRHKYFIMNKKLSPSLQKSEFTNALSGPGAATFIEADAEIGVN